MISVDRILLGLCWTLSILLSATTIVHAQGDTEKTCTADSNKIWNQCGTSCPEYCYWGGMPVCNRKCNIGCTCDNAKDYVFEAWDTNKSEEENMQGKCVKRSECPAPETCSDPDKVYKSCGSSCPEHCNQGNVACDKMCNPGCFCKDGMVLESWDTMKSKEERMGGKCVKKEECPAAGTCQENKVLKECAPRCPDRCGKKPEICAADCITNVCVCDEANGWVFEHWDKDKSPKENMKGGCVKKDQCSTTKEIKPVTTDGQCSDPNKEYSECSSRCPKYCGQPEKIACTLDCVQACTCKQKEGLIYKTWDTEKGALENMEGECIKETECGDSSGAQIMASITVLIFALSVLLGL